MAIKDRRFSGEDTDRVYSRCLWREFVISRKFPTPQRARVIVPCHNQEEGNASRRVRAGRQEVLTYEEERERLRGTRLGEILGLNNPGLA